MTQAYPLQWPRGWPRTSPSVREDSRYRFKHKGTDGWNRPVTLDVARRKMCEELDRLGALNVVISTNVPLRADGSPRSPQASERIQEPGVAIYFQLKGRPMVMASDRYDAPSANIRSIGLAVEAMRQLSRHGGGAMMERAFAGFAALSPPSSDWRSVFGLSGRTVNKEIIQSRFRELAHEAHPDKGGSHDKMATLVAARDAAMEELQ